MNDEFNSTTLREMTSRLIHAEHLIDDLRRENARTRHDFNTLAAKFEAALIFFESRVDAVYQSALLQAKGEPSPFKVISAVETEKRLQELIFSGFIDEPQIDELNLKDIISGDLSIGVKKGPLTLYGFRLHPGASRDLGNRVRIESGEFGAVVFGPYKRLRTGRYKVRFDLDLQTAVDELSGSMSFDIFDGTSGEVVCAKTVSAPDFAPHHVVELSFAWEPQTPNHLIEIRTFQGLQCVVFLNEIVIEADE
ncbi:hypothetical protein [Pararhizobium qamdonense]|uniref:hypothetical protein n=1 Tax=Pararhizobium qamdonense TaxID=3031126 RepID=UPI0023E19583|nr:hypothetical protein [Pararhizobium qamdonense]